MKLQLISPGSPVRDSTKKDRAAQFARLSLTTVAALTPSEVDVELIDDNTERLSFDPTVDMVGITAMTATAPRAYEIADRYRRNGVSVVLGGIHPSVLPREAIEHADAVVVGEAEGTWRNLLRDFEKGKMKSFYRSQGRPSLDNLPTPRRDLLRSRVYKRASMVQATRGCPFDCDFCAVSNFFGRTYRFRPIPDVIGEIERLKNRFIFIADDNIVGSPKYAKQLFRSLIPLRIKWFGQGSVTMARDEELLRLAAKSGCTTMFIGFESLSEANLREVGKKTNRVSGYEEDVRRIHNHGIAIDGAFMFGFDHDDEDVFERTVDFAKTNKLELTNFSILTPFPGTRLYDRLEKENRIIDRDWSKYTCGNVVFRPRLLSEDRLQAGYLWARRQFYSYSSIFRRLFGGGKRSVWCLPANLNMRRAAYRSGRSVGNERMMSRERPEGALGRASIGGGESAKW